jgi:hypothetical protein
MPRVSVAEYSRIGMLTRPKAIEPFQIDFMQTLNLNSKLASVYDSFRNYGDPQS